MKYHKIVSITVEVNSYTTQEYIKHKYVYLNVMQTVSDSFWICARHLPVATRQIVYRDINKYVGYICLHDTSACFFTVFYAENFQTI